jgi:hypothetical protein
VLIEERSAALRVSQAPSGTALASARARPHGALVLVAACVLIAALTLLLPSAPTYDPWAWIIWGREIAHLDLVTTGGPSWKPLPVAFTTIFSFFGSWSPDLWLVVAREVLHDAGLMLTTPLIVGLLCCGVMIMFRRGRVMAVLIAMSIAWLGLVAYMTSDGFSGNQRYLMGPVALLMVLGGAGIGWALQLVVDGVARYVPAVRSVGRRPSLVVVVLASALVGLVFAAPSFERFSPNLKGLKYQAQLADELPGLIRSAGGAEKLKACGKPFTGPFLVPVVAWNLRMHTKDVQLTPSVPSVTFRVRTNAGSRPVPSLKDVGDDVTLATSSKWRIVAACGSPGA